MSYPSKTYRIDVNSQRITGSIDGKAALLQFIDKTFATNKYAWRYYNQNFGNEFDKLLGKSKGYIMARFPILAKQALMTDDRINDVHDFEFEDDEYEGNKL